MRCYSHAILKVIYYISACVFYFGRMRLNNDAFTACQYSNVYGIVTCLSFLWSLYLHHFLYSSLKSQESIHLNCISFSLNPLYLPILLSFSSLKAVLKSFSFDLYLCLSLFIYLLCIIPFLIPLSLSPKAVCPS